MEMNAWILTVLGTGLGVAVVTDVSTHRIPNWLTLSTGLVCLALQAWFGQWNGLLLGLEGFFVGLFCFLPSHLFGAMGAGDVKLMAAVGTAIGPWPAFVAVLMTVVAGGAIALVFITAKGGMGDMFRRYASMVRLLVLRQPRYLAPEPDEAAAIRFPYALAIACGTAMSVWWVSGQRSVL